MNISKVSHQPHAEQKRSRRHAKNHTHLSMFMHRLHCLFCYIVVHVKQKHRQWSVRPISSRTTLMTMYPSSVTIFPSPQK